MFLGFRVPLILPLAFLVGAFILGMMFGFHAQGCRLAPDPYPVQQPIPVFPKPSNNQ